MDVQQAEPRISQLLQVIKCSDCGQTIDFQMLGEHICQAAPAVPTLPAMYQNSNKILSNKNLNLNSVNNAKSIKQNSGDSRPNLVPLSVGVGNSYNNAHQYIPRPPHSPYESAPSPTDSGYSSAQTNKYGNVVPGTTDPNRFMQKYNYSKSNSKQNDPSSGQLFPSRLANSSSDDNGNRKEYFNNSYNDPLKRYPSNQNLNNNNQHLENNYSTNPEQFVNRPINYNNKTRDPYSVDKPRTQVFQENVRGHSSPDKQRELVRGNDSERERVRALQNQRQITGSNLDRPYDREYGQSASFDNHNRFNSDDPYSLTKIRPQQPIEKYGQYDKYSNSSTSNKHNILPNRGEDRFNLSPNQNGVLKNEQQNYNNIRREEDRNLARSPAPYELRNERSEYNNPRYPPPVPSSNQGYGNRGDDEASRKFSNDRNDNQQPPYSYDSSRSHTARNPSYEQNNLPLPRAISPNPLLPLNTLEANKNSHISSRNGSFSSQNSNSSQHGNNKIGNGQTHTSKTGSGEQYNGGFDNLIDDLLREMDNMDTKSSNSKPINDRIPENSSHVKNKSSSSQKQDICAYCNHEISSTPMWALGRSWHPEHLLCAQCEKPIDPNIGHVERNEKVYCPTDFADLFLPKCRSCGLPVEREAVSASDGKLEGKWHVKCFGCHTCHKAFPDKSFYVFDNAPYCIRHYHKLNNSLCKNCDEPIEGPCAQTVETWRYHPSCFVCFACRNPLTDIYYSFENKQYCETHIMEMQQRRKIRAEKRQTLFRNI